MRYKSYDIDDYKNIRDLTDDEIKCIEKITEKLKKQLVYRGIDFKTYKNFYEFIFIGGDKARFNLFTEFENELDYRDVEHWNRKKKEYFNNILQHLKKHFQNFCDYNIGGDIDAIIENIKEFRKRNKQSYYNMYIKVLCILHIVQNKAPFQKKIPCVSTSRSKAIAQDKFATLEKNKTYTLVAFLNKASVCQYIETKNVYNFCNVIGIKGFQDIYKEVIFLDCIFPHNILGVIERDSTGDETFIINPHLVKMIQNEKFVFATVLKNMKKDGIDIDQEQFYEKLEKDTLYKKIILQMDHRRLMESWKGRR